MRAFTMSEFKGGARQSAPYLTFPRKRGKETEEDGRSGAELDRDGLRFSTDVSLSVSLPCKAGEGREGADPR